MHLCDEVWAEVWISRVVEKGALVVDRQVPCHVIATPRPQGCFAQNQGQHTQNTRSVGVRAMVSKLINVLWLTSWKETRNFRHALQNIHISVCPFGKDRTFLRLAKRVTFLFKFTDYIPVGFLEAICSKRLQQRAKGLKCFVVLFICWENAFFKKWLRFILCNYIFFKC